MKWQIVSPDNSIFAKRLSLMFGIEMVDRPRDPFDGLFWFQMMPWALEAMRGYKGVPKICYWTGTDAKVFVENQGTSCDFGQAIHITDSPWLVSRLGQEISDVCFVPLPAYLPFGNVPFPEDPGILMYLTKHGAQNIERAKALIRCIRDIPIYVMQGFGARAIEKGFQANVIPVGTLEDDMRDIVFGRVSVFIRLMHHDGLSATVVEMKTLGRHVLWTNPAPYCGWVSPGMTPVEIAEKARSFADRGYDKEGASWYRRMFGWENFLRIMKRLCSLKGWGFDHE